MNKKHTLDNELPEEQLNKPDPNLKIYLSEVAKIPLLSKEEEVELAKLVKQGDKKAKEKMIRSNLRLVVKVANRFKGKGLDLMDLIQEGTFGLTRAIEKFDWERGLKLSTYACVPPSTQILTRNGWKYWKELDCGTDETLGYDNGFLKWTPVYGTTAYDKAPIVRFGDALWHTYCTPQHKWLISQNDIVSLCPLTEWPDADLFEFPKRDQLTGKYRRPNIKLITAAPFIGGSLEITPNEAALLGWVLSDGSLYKRRREDLFEGGCIIQSHKKYVHEVRSLLRNLGAYCSDIKHGESCIKFHIATHVLRDIWERSKIDKFGPLWFVLNLKFQARRAWFRAWYMAEGTIGRRYITQNNGENQEAIALTAFLEGKPGVKVSAKTETCGIVSWHRKERTPRRCIVQPSHEGAVWCPNTGLGSWTARDKDGHIFITGNTWWIRQAAQRALSDKSRTIRVPVHVLEHINKITKGTQDFIQSHGKEPTLEDKADMIEQDVMKTKMIVESTKQTASLTISETNESVLDILVTEETPGDFLTTKGLVEDTAELVSNLPYRECKTLVMRTGLGMDPCTLKIVGDDFNLTRERIRQIERLALRKIYCDEVMP